MMIPEAWENHESMDAGRKAFYRYHASLMEPWDGPASIAFTDGTVIGAVLDRNGLRPSRYWVTDDDLVVMASEVGVLDLAPGAHRGQGPARTRQDLPRRHRAGAPRARRRDQGDARGRAAVPALARRRPRAISTTCRRSTLTPVHSSAVQLQRLFGYTEEDLRLLITPMARNAVESLGSMGTDTPPPVLSDRPRMLYEYFKQLFAQVTNPPLDANFEVLVTSLSSTIGAEGNLLDPTSESCRQIVLPYPVISNDDLAKLRYIDREAPELGYHPVTMPCLYPVLGGGDALHKALDGHPPPGERRDRGRRQHRDPLRPLRDRRARADPGAARDRRRAPPPRAHQDPHAGRPRRRDRRGA